MRRSFWIIAVLFVAISAPNAHADSFIYTYTSTDFGISWTTAAISAVTMETTLPAADLTATSNTGFVAGCVTSSVVLDASGIGGTISFLGSCGGFVNFADGFTLTDYATPGIHVSPTGDTLVVTAAVATPEPSSVALMLAGLGFVFVIRKRIGQGLPLAT